MADVTGHGVPAALIASMIKVAMQSVIPYALTARSFAWLEPDAFPATP